MQAKVMNLVNFVRGCEPRKKTFDLYTPVVNELAENRKHGLKSTFLLQYDAMLREDFCTLFQAEREKGDLELGVWFEMCRALCETVGIEWRGRPGFDWDWYVNPGFLPAYTQAEREAIIDEVFRKFRELFGAYPRVACSWLLDAHSMAYMSDKYGMDAFGICREQYAVDAYTLWGGYYSGGYYPSRNNMLCPAQHTDAQINTPVFRLLGIDPIYGYDEGKHAPKLSGCYTMEPGWASGQDRDVMEWYFKCYYQSPCISGSFATTGQENSFGWRMIENGYPLQAELIADWKKRGLLQLEWLGETGKKFKEIHKKTPPSALVAMDDWSGNDLQSVWYSSSRLRADLFYKEGCLILRDLQKFDDGVKERYWETPCTAWQATYENLPLVDNRLWSEEENEAAITFESSVLHLADCCEEEGRLLVTVSFADGHCGTVCFEEDRITFADCGTLYWSFGTGKVFCGAKGNTLHFSYNGADYRVCVAGKVTQEPSGCRLAPENEQIGLQI